MIDVHPAADLFPMMSDEEIDALGADMLEHGQREPIILYREQILDGRNRYRACILKGIEPRYRDELPADPYAFVASANLRRRHLDESQRAMIAATLATMRRGRLSDNASQGGNKTQSEAAALLKVSRPSVQRARIVRERGVPDLVDAVKHGDVKVKPAAEFAQTTPPLDQARLIAEHGSPAAAVQATVKAKARHAADDPIQEPYDADCITDQQRWEWSLGQYAGEAIAMRALWTRHFGNWERFERPPALVKLIEEAARAWGELAS